MNLATAGSGRRAREVGIRKVVGACRRDLVGQFLGESTSTSLLALIVGLVFVQLALPLFKSISGIELRLGAGELAWLIPMFFGLALFVGFAAGSYPAIYLSAFQPVKALKGGPSGSEAKSGSVRFRRLLVVGQFALSIAMITGTWIIGDQIRYMKNKDIGFQKEQVLGIRTSDQKILKTLDSIKSRPKEIPGVLEISATSFVPGAGQSTNAVVPEGFEGDTSAIYRVVNADADFVRTMGMEIAKGRDFSKISPGSLFDYFFIDELFDAQYRSEERLNKIFSSFSLLAIAIACLGLFGLASYIAERRKKEVGIRKVLGASLGGVVGLLAKEFLKLVGLAALIAWPIAYFAMNIWLRGFAYRTQINLWTFAVSGLAALAIAFLTVSYQAVRAALANPVDSLKYE